MRENRENAGNEVAGAGDLLCEPGKPESEFCLSISATGRISAFYTNYSVPTNPLELEIKVLLSFSLLRFLSFSRFAAAFTSYLRAITTVFTWFDLGTAAFLLINAELKSYTV